MAVYNGFYLNVKAYFNIDNNHKCFLSIRSSY